MSSSRLELKASFSGSKSEMLGTTRECCDDADELRVLFMSLAISRTNWALCCELPDCDMVLFVPQRGGAAVF